MSQPQQAIFSLEKLYVKDLSVELPHAPKIFLNSAQPTIDLNLKFETEKIDDGMFQTVLCAVVDAKINNEQMFLIEVHQAGIFRMQNIPLDQMEILQNIECPGILFPYLREAVSSLTTHAGFAPVILTPVNFAALYQQKQQAGVAAINNTIN